MAVNILICDDSGVLRKLIARTLRQLSFEIGEIYEAGDGQQGLVEVENHGDKINIILLDWNMPNMDGITFLKTIRGKGIQTPVVMITTEATDAKVTEATQNGANGYVCKPFTPASMEKELSKFIS